MIRRRIGLVWLIGFAAGLVTLLPKSAAVPILWGYVAMETAHAFAPITLAWINPHLRQEAVASPWRFLGLPAAAAAFMFAVPFWLAFTVFTWLNAWHFGMQNFGILRLLGARRRGLLMMACLAVSFGAVFLAPRLLSKADAIFLMMFFSANHWVTDLGLTGMASRWWIPAVLLVAGCVGFSWYHLTPNGAQHGLPMMMRVAWALGLAHFAYSRWVWQHGRELLRHAQPPPDTTPRGPLGALLLVFLFLCLVASSDAGAARRLGSGIGVAPVWDEEFSGPLAGWINAKTGAAVEGGGAVCTGATGNGSTDDTAALRSCLSVLGSSHPTLYIPAGTYKITQSLYIAAQQYINIIGEDPATASIVWGGTSSSSNAASFTGNIVSVSGGTSTLNITGGLTGTVAIGQTVSCSACTRTVKIVSGSGNTWTVFNYGNNTLAQASQTITTQTNAMLWLNGIGHSKISRLTFDAQSLVKIAVDQAWQSSGTNYSDTGNEYSDVVFANAVFGFQCGALGFQCSETSMLRDQFIGNTGAGISTAQANALNIWVWYCLFQSNLTGVVSTYSGAGNFFVYNSVFLNSPEADIEYGNVSVFAFVGNYSVGSKRFISAGGTGAPDNATIQGNTVLDTTDALSIWQNDSGPVVLVDNVIRTSPGAAAVSFGGGNVATAAAGPVAVAGNGNPRASDLYSMGNTFTTGTGTCTVTSPAWGSGRCHSFSDQVVSAGSITPLQPALPPTPPNRNRTIFEAAAGGSGTTCSAAVPCSIQQAVTSAAAAEAAGDIHPIAHIRFGSYSIGSTITVPATVNTGIQIVGDGSYSALTWTGAGGGGPVMKLTGPNKSTVREIQISGSGSALYGIEVANADQANSRVFMEQPSTALNGNNILVDSLDYTNVEIHDAQHWLASGVSLNASGGGASGGSTNIYGGVSFANVTAAYGSSGSAHLNVNSTFNDAGGCGATCVRAATVTGTGAFTYGSSYIGVFVPPSTDTMLVNNFTGTLGLVNLYAAFGNINMSGVGTGGQYLGLGLVGPNTTFFNVTASGSPTVEFLLGQSDPTPGGGGNGIVTETGCCNSTFLASTLNQLRSNHPSVIAPIPGPVTDARIYRVYVISSTTAGIHLVH